MRLLRLSIFCLVSALSITSCVKQEFDSPPDSSKVDPMLPVNGTIGSIADNALDMAANKSRILGDTTIYGIVIGDDRSGNIYKQIIIEDSTGRAITLILDKTTLYGDYPVGRKIYVKLKGLYLVNYRGLPEIAYSADATGSTNGIPSTLLKNYIVVATYPNYITPKTVTMSDLFSNPGKYLNSLVKLDNMQFDLASANVPYSLPTSSTNRIIKDCPNTGSLTMYNSSFSNFQAAITPKGKGSITGIFTTYYTTPQFVLRDTTDVSFTAPRDCP